MRNAEQWVGASTTPRYDAPSRRGYLWMTVKPRDEQKEKPVVKTPFGTITRRNFVKAAAATAATAGIAGGLLGCASNSKINPVVERRSRTSGFRRCATCVSTTAASWAMSWTASSWRSRATTAAPPAGAICAARAPRASCSSTTRTASPKPLTSHEPEQGRRHRPAVGGDHLG